MKKEPPAAQNKPRTLKTLLLKILKIIAWGFAAFLALFLIITLLLQFPAVQTRIIGQITNILSERIDTRVEIERVAIRFPKSIGLKGIYVEDERGDTLLFAGSIFADVGMTALLRQRVKVNSLELKNVHGNMLRSEPDTVYNFQFIIDAFASDSELQEEEKQDLTADDTEKGWRVMVDRLKLENIRFRMKDHFTGLNLDVDLGKLNTRLRNADLLNGRYHLGASTIDGLRVEIQQDIPTRPSPPKPGKISGPVLDIAIEKLNLTNIHFLMSSHDGTHMAITLRSLNLIPNTFSLHEHIIDLNTLEVDGLDAAFLFPKREVALVDTLPAVASENFTFSFSSIMDWHVKLNRFHITQSQFSMQQGKQTESQSMKFDPANLQLAGITLEAKDIVVSPRELNIDLKNLSARFSPEFSLSNFTAHIELNPQQTNIRNLSLQTLHSRLAFSLTSPANLLEFSQEELLQQTFTLELGQNLISADLAYMIPALNDFYFNWPGNRGLKFGGNLQGQLNQFAMDSLWLTAPDFFTFHTTGSIAGLPQIDSLQFDIRDLKLFAAPRRFAANLPDSLHPQSIHLPRYIYLDSRTSGKLSNLQSTTQLRTDLGSIFMEASTTPLNDSIFQYEGVIAISALQAGKLLMQEETLPDPLDITLQLAGSGIKPGQINLQGTIDIENLVLMGHSYTPMQLLLSINDELARLQTTYTDDALDMQLDASYGIFSETPALEASLEVDYARLQQLGFIEQDLLVRSSLQASLLFDVDDFFNGIISITQTQIASEGEIYTIPALILTSESSPASYQMNLQSRFANAIYSGNFSPVLLPQILGIHLSHYYDLGMESTPETGEHQFFELKVSIIPDDLITELILPALSHSDTLHLITGYNSRERDIVLEASLGNMSFGAIQLEDFSMRVVSDIDRLDFSLLLNSLSINDIMLKELVLSGDFANEVLQFALALKDAELNPLYNLSASLIREDSLSVFVLSNEGLLLYGDAWNIPPDNRIRFASSWVEVNNFRLHSQGRELSAQSRQTEPFPIIDLNFQQIDLGQLTGIAAGQIAPIGGLFNGSLSLKDIFGTPVFLADLTISDFSFDGDTLGNISLKAENPIQNRYDIVASLRSEATQMAITGNYMAGDETALNLEVELQRLDLPSFEGFAAGNITHLKGHLSGHMQVTGNTQAPLISGNLNINETSFRVPAINAGYFIRGANLTFDRSRVRMQNVALEDSAGRRATLAGSIDISDFSQIAFNLNLSSRNFLLMNVESGQNDLYHGRVLVDTDLQIQGTQHNPSIQGRVKLNEGSGFTLILPQSSPETVGDEGVVEFVQTRDTTFLHLARQTGGETVISTAFDILDVSVNLEIDPKTDVRIVIDRYAGDFVQVKGGGLLSFGIDPGGRITLSGRYDISDGEYLLTFYDVIRRNFRIQSGSHVIWTGDPMQASIDLTAIYTIRTSARELLADQMGSTQTTALRQQFPFQVFLRMRGSLEKPDIRFELNLPQQHHNAFDGALLAQITYLNQNESELNKQVFALLMLGNFIQDNPFASMGEGSGLSSTARTSASQILTQQLNRLSDRYIRGLDINVEVESSVDYTSGQAAGSTELQLEVSQRFFDDRVRVTVGGNIELEDETRRSREATDIAGDFTIEYLLTPEGNLRLKGFRTKNYADIFDGQVIETGIAVLFSRSYNQFRELFKRKESEAIKEEEIELED